ncbi:hypothetical protein D3C80_2152680 [compost metagenome]
MGFAFATGFAVAFVAGFALAFGFADGFAFDSVFGFAAAAARLPEAGAARSAACLAAGADVAAIKCRI